MQKTLICHRATSHNKPTPLRLRATLLKGTLLSSSTPSLLPTNSPAVVLPKVALKDVYLIASHTTDYQHPMLFFNTLTVFVVGGCQVPTHAQGPNFWNQCGSVS
ncbi:unnamed protein product [Camellia sinensis]